MTIDSWNKNKYPLLIAGPCSAESEEQLMETVRGLQHLGVSYIRAGVWKPRTRPNSFEGYGAVAFEWIKAVADELGVAFATEVASPEHVELALKHDIKLLWVGARTTVNPFNVQEIAESLRGVDIPVLVKNPVNPDLSLWIGALERMSNVGVTKLGAIHRGFSTHQKSEYRNIPLWKIAIELKTNYPDLMLIGDPSHIAGRRDKIQKVAQKALDLNYDGLMIETHYRPDMALSDAQQQLSPLQLGETLANLVVRRPNTKDHNFEQIIEEIRAQIDEADREIIDALARRFSLVDRIGAYKKENNVAIFQISRWKEVFETRQEWGKSLQLDEEFIKDIFRLIHQESIKTQTKIFDEYAKKHSD